MYYDWFMKRSWITWEVTRVRFILISSSKILLCSLLTWLNFIKKYDAGMMLLSCCTVAADYFADIQKLYRKQEQCVIKNPPPRFFITITITIFIAYKVLYLHLCTYFDAAKSHLQQCCVITLWGGTRIFFPLFQNTHLIMYTSYRVKSQRIAIILYKIVLNFIFLVCIFFMLFICVACCIPISNEFIKGTSWHIIFSILKIGLMRGIFIVLTCVQF